MPTTPKPRKSKGKQHPIHAESLEHIAKKIKGQYFPLTGHQLYNLLMDEVERVRTILR